MIDSSSLVELSKPEQGEYRNVGLKSSGQSDVIRSIDGNLGPVLQFYAAPSKSRIVEVESL